MVLGIREAMEVEKKFGELNVPLFLLTDMRYQPPGGAQKAVRRGTQLEPSLLQELVDAGESRVNCVYSEKLLMALSRLFPQQYRLPFRTVSYVELDKILHAMVKINSMSRRKREVICVDEVYRKEESLVSVLLPYGSTLDLETWNAVKIKIDRKRKFAIRFNEHGIIVFVDLRADGPDYLQRFYRNSDLVTSLVGHRHDATTVIAPDFLSEFDVYTVDDPGRLLPVYMENQTRLIIVGDVLSDEYKKALIAVRNHDKFARFIVATNIDQKNLDIFLSQVKKSYCSDNFDFEEYS
jgi:hypothetical protein